MNKGFDSMAVDSNIGYYIHGTDEEVDKDFCIGMFRGSNNGAESMQTIGCITTTVPSTIRHPYKHLAVWGQRHTNHCRGESFTKRKARALVLALNLFEKHAMNPRMRKVSHEKLPGKGPELAVSVVQNDVSRASSHLHIRKPDGWWNKLRDGSNRLRVTRIGLDGHRQFQRRIGSRLWPKSVRMAVERAAAQMMKRVGWNPVALLVGKEHIALRVGAESAR